MSEWKLADRMKEFSTYEGLTVIAGLAGYAVTDGQINVVGAAAMGLYGLIKMFKKEK